MFQIKLAVRDYECDMQGIVNNAIYLNYFEHARHQFLITKGLDFAEITKQGIFAVIYRSELDYLRPLKSGDDFLVTVRCARVSNHKCMFEQTISVGAKTYTKAKIFVAAVNDNGRPVDLSEMEIEKLYEE